MTDQTIDDQDDALPKGWVWTTLGEICTNPQYGYTTSASYTGDGPKFLRITDLTAGHVDWITVPFCKEPPENSNQFKLFDGDLVIARSGATVGKAYRVSSPPDAVFASYLIRFRAILVLDRYIEYFLQSPLYWSQIRESSTGTAQPNVNAQKMTRLRLSLAPLPEQQRIVNTIESLFTQLDAGIAALKRVQANLRRYKAAVLKAACEGRLVPQDPNDEPASELLKRILDERRAKWEADLRAKGKDPRRAKYEEPAPPDTEGLSELPEGWVWATLDQLSFHVTSGSRGWAKYYAEKGSLFLRVGNFKRSDISLDLGNAVFVEPPAGTEGERTRLQLDDLLITITADVGMVGVVDERTIQHGEAFLNQHVALVRLSVPKIVWFVAYCIASEFGQSQVRALQYGATKLGLGLADLKSLVVPLAPAEEQARIVPQVEKMLSQSDQLKRSGTHNIRRAERMRQSILKRAFEGKLVPQDPVDESASALLERIHAEGANHGSPSKRTRKTRNTNEQPRLL